MQRSANVLVTVLYDAIFEPLGEIRRQVARSETIPLDDLERGMWLVRVARVANGDRVHAQVLVLVDLDKNICNLGVLVRRDQSELPDLLGVYDRLCHLV